MIRLPRTRRAATVALLISARALFITLPAADAAFAAKTAISTNKWDASTAWCTGAGQKLGNPGFETGTAAPWTVTLPTEINNQLTQASHTGLWDAWLAPTPTVPEMLSQTVTLPTGCSAATLSFYMHTEFKGGSGNGMMTVQVLNSGGTVLATLATFVASNSSGYAQFSYNVQAYLGQTITVKFNSTTTGLRLPSFVLDDTALIVS